MSNNSATTVRPKELGGKSFQSLIAGWEYNTNVGKGVTATTLVSFPSNSNLASVASETKPTIIKINHQESVAQSPQSVEIYEEDSKPLQRPNSIFNSSLFSSSNNLSLPVTSSSSSTNRNAAIREQFLLNGSSTSLLNSPSTPNTPSRQLVTTADCRVPTTPTYGLGGYRFAGVERLAQRSKIYETPKTPTSNSVESQCHANKLSPSCRESVSLCCMM